MRADATRNVRVAMLGSYGFSTFRPEGRDDVTVRQLALAQNLTPDRRLACPRMLSGL
jgi:hypothetical protein